MTLAVSVPRDAHIYFARASQPEACLLALHYTIFGLERKLLKFAGGQVFETHPQYLGCPAYNVVNWASKSGVQRPVTLNPAVVNTRLVEDLGRILVGFCSTYEMDMAVTLHDEVHGKLVFLNVRMRQNMSFEPRACPPHQVYGWDTADLRLPQELLKQTTAA